MYYAIGTSAAAITGVGGYFLYRMYKKQKAKYIANLLLKNLKNNKVTASKPLNDEIRKLLKLNKPNTD